MLSSNIAVRTLQSELRHIRSEPVEGFIIKLVNEENIFEWEVAIFGPPNTLYEGGYFKALMTFPQDYPYSPPTVRFLSRLWHPNIYADGEVCISILHPPVDDSQSGEQLSERWNPTQSVRTILMSIISLLNEPNTYSPANVDASIMYRNYICGNDKAYETLIRKHVIASQIEAEKDGVRIPRTLEEYVVKTTPPSASDESTMYAENYEDDSIDFLSDSADEETECETEKDGKNDADNSEAS